MSGWCLKAVCRVSQRCLEGIYGMSEWHVRCLDVSEGQVMTSQVRICKVRTGQVSGCLEGDWKLSRGYLEGVWGLSGGCLKGIWKVSGGCTVNSNFFLHVNWPSLDGSPTRKGWFFSNQTL